MEKITNKCSDGGGRYKTQVALLLTWVMFILNMDN